jgi:methylmalonyl-CoA mutase C-terminal domain/subunit
VSPAVRILVAKPGLDGHDRGVKVIARALRDGGFEVLYTGLHQTPEQIVAAALQEDVDAIGVSIMSGAHMTLIPRILELLRNEHSDVTLFAGGIIPEADAAELKRRGVAEIFTPGASTDAVIAWARANIHPKTASTQKVG